MPADPALLNPDKRDCEELAALVSEADRHSQIVSESAEVGPQVGVRPMAIELAPEVVNFSQAHGILSGVERAIQLARKHFAPKSLAVYLSGDPEGDEQWIVVRSDVPGTVNSVLDAYGRLKDEWLSDGTFKFTALVRFLYNII